MADVETERCKYCQTVLVVTYGTGLSGFRPGERWVFTSHNDETCREWALDWQRELEKIIEAEAGEKARLQRSLAMMRQFTDACRDIMTLEQLERLEQLDTERQERQEQAAVAAAIRDSRTANARGAAYLFQDVLP